MFSTYLDEFSSILRKTIATNSSSEIELDEAYTAVVGQMEEVRKKKSHVYLVGNGGSSAIVSHAAIDLLNACGFKAHALTDNSLLTCMANDYGYENVFAQPLKTLFEEGDVLVAISSSGKSPNIVNACRQVKNKAAAIITFSGFAPDNPLRASGDFNFWLESSDYGIVEIGHSLLFHHITDKLYNKD
ncbi:MAG: phosphoheptose isomerase [Verrucomicrobia bacterium]|nr:phosphoheptose isomerase [Verrucomicrobiota bacterium]|tara:strand:+ start:134 stop:694 length:561 start_codon:yes stop_codon:yes gene_type:complete